MPQPQRCAQRNALVIASTQEDIESLRVDVDTGQEPFVGTATLAVRPGNANDLIIVPPGEISPKGGRSHDKPTRQVTSRWSS